MPRSSDEALDFLTLAGVPPEAFEYRLGNRSALGWIIDQYQVSTDKRSKMSMETVKIAKGLPPLAQ